MTNGSVTYWLKDFIGGDEEAARKIWERYFANLARLAQQKLQDTPRRVADEEDVAQNAFISFWRGARQGNFARLEDRHDLWQLLVMITARKAVDQIHKQNALKRGGGKVRGESAFTTPENGRPRGLEQVISGEPTPAFAAELADQCQLLLEKLDDDGLRQICLLKIQRCTNEEIAERLGCTRRTVQRRIRLIQHIWQAEIDR